MNLAQEIKICNGLAPQDTLDGGVNGAGIDLSNAHMLYIVVHLVQTVDGALIRPERGNAAEGFIVMANNVKIWENEALATNDRLERLLDGLDRTTTNTPGNKLIVMQVNPSSLGDHTAGDNLPCNQVRCHINTAEAADVASILYYVVPRFAQGTLPEMRI